MIDKDDVRILKRSQIDTITWDHKVSANAHGLPYAYSIYLDITTDKQWEAVVYKDYEAIIPLPYRLLFGLKYYTQPILSQQLGLISENYHAKFISELLNFIPDIKGVFNLKWNELNTHIHTSKYQVKKRTNFVLDLNQSYQTIFDNYAKNLRTPIRKGRRYYSYRESFDINDFLYFYKTQMQSKVQMSHGQYRITKDLITHLTDQNMGSIYQAVSDQKVDAMVFIIRSNNRLINLINATTEDGYRQAAMPFLLDQIIQKNAETNSVFDFEGSDITGVKSFYSGFNPTMKPYLELYLDRSPIWFRYLRAIKNKVSKQGRR